MASSRLAKTRKELHDWFQVIRKGGALPGRTTFMFVALAIVIVLGATIGGATAVSDRYRIADELPIAALVGMSGAIAGWALFDTVSGLGHDTLDLWDVVGAVTGAVALIVAAWRGRQRTFGELGLSAHSD
jgi:hypothetical protein